jgi:hypothetical protein
MSASIVSAEEARGLLEGATPGPLLEEDGWWPPYANGACPECGRKRGHVDGCTVRAEFNRVAAARAALSKAAPDLAHTVIAIEVERDAALARVARLERVLAVERGDASQAPSGWAPTSAGTGWRNRDDGYVHLVSPGRWAVARVQGRAVIGDGKTYDTALQAMEAADAAGEVAPQ